jgi:hypothetical protein
MDKSAKAQIRNLLVVIGSAIVFACAAAAMMVRVYGPTGDYQLSNVLLSPETARTMAYRQLVFDHIEYAQRDQETKMWKPQSISLDQYQKFYSTVEKAQSQQFAAAAAAPFSHHTPSTLTLFVRPATEPVGSRVKVFQVVEFVPDDFRVELHADKMDSTSKWVYFHYPEIGKLVSKTFGSSTQ